MLQSSFHPTSPAGSPPRTRRGFSRPPLPELRSDATLAIMKRPTGQAEDDASTRMADNEARQYRRLKRRSHSSTPGRIVSRRVGWWAVLLLATLAGIAVAWASPS